MKLPFNNPGKAVLGIVLVILLWALYAANAEAEEFLELSAGPTFTSEFNGGMAISLAKRFHRNVDAGILIVSEQEWEAVRVENNGAFWARFVVHRPARWWSVLPAEIHIGASYWFKVNPPINGQQEGFLLGLSWDLPGEAKWLPDAVTVDHRSNAGTGKPNRGQDMLMFNWRW